jgi:CHAD domain-containing protein
VGEPAHEGRPRTADDVIRSIILTTADHLITTQSAAIADAPDGVHQHRTHVRRLRSVLAGFRDHLDEAAARDLRVQFSEWGQQLGVVRDFEVQADVAASAMDDLGIDDPAMRARLVDAEREAHATAHMRLCELHDGPRSIARMAALEAFAADPPLTAKAHGKVMSLAAVAKHEARRVRRAAKRADGSTESLHAVRKAGRRLRYVAEALHAAMPEAFGADFEELAEAGEDVHDALGDHRDELIFIDRVEIARTQAGRAGERVEPYDELIARSAERAKASLAGLDAALDRVKAALAAL